MRGFLLFVFVCLLLVWPVVIRSVPHTTHTHQNQPCLIQTAQKKHTENAHLTFIAIQRPTNNTRTRQRPQEVDFGEGLHGLGQQGHQGLREVFLDEPIHALQLSFVALGAGFVAGGGRKLV